MPELRRFLNSEIAPAIVAAVEAIPSGFEIVEFKAGENMPITATFAPEEVGLEEVADPFTDHSWNGEQWVTA